VPTLAIHLATDPGRNAPRGAHVNVVTAARPGARRGRARTAPSGEVSVAAVERAVQSMLERSR
jgi:hypothetical protein